MNRNQLPTDFEKRPCLHCNTEIVLAYQEDSVLKDLDHYVCAKCYTSEKWKRKYMKAYMVYEKQKASQKRRNEIMRPYKENQARQRAYDKFRKGLYSGKIVHEACEHNRKEGLRTDEVDRRCNDPKTKVVYFNYDPVTIRWYCDEHHSRYKEKAKFQRDKQMEGFKQARADRLDSIK